MVDYTVDIEPEYVRPVAQMLNEAEQVEDFPLMKAVVDTYISYLGSKNCVIYGQKSPRIHCHPFANKILPAAEYELFKKLSDENLFNPIYQVGIETIHTTMYKKYKSNTKKIYKKLVTHLENANVLTSTSSTVNVNEEYNDKEQNNLPNLPYNTIGYTGVLAGIAGFSSLAMVQQTMPAMAIALLVGAATATLSGGAGIAGSFLQKTEKEEELEEGFTTGPKKNIRGLTQKYIHRVVSEFPAPSEADSK